MSQIDNYSLRDFDRIEQQLRACKTQIESLDIFAEERSRKFENGLKSYKKYIQNENAMLMRNRSHCQDRNEHYLSQVKKAWKVGISNRTVVLKSVTRTNIMKRDIDQWISKLDNQMFENSNQPLDILHQGAQLSGSKLIDRYKQILNEYNLK